VFGFNYIKAFVNTRVCASLSVKLRRPVVGILVHSKLERK